MEFKVGDRVQVVATYSSFRGDKGNVTENDGTDNLPIKVRFDEGNHACWFYEDDLKVLYEEEKVMKFKVGDKVKIGDRVQIYETYSDYYGRCGIVIGDDFCPTFPYKVEFEDGDDCIFKGKDLIVLSTEKFKVGDLVKIVANWSCNFGMIGEIKDDSYLDNLFKVVFDESKSGAYDDYDLELVIEEEKVMKFKVGDKVKVKDSWFGHDGQVGVVLDTDNCEPYNYNIKFDTEGYNERRDENFKEDSLELVTEEEETSMKFKVGDKVKVSNSWEGRSGEVGEIIGADDRYKFKYTVAFNDGFAESFREGELELVKEKAVKQSFTKSDLKTGMGVVLRDGSKGHVLIATPTQDTIRFIEKDEWVGLDDYADDLTIENFKQLDIIAVYNTKFENHYMTDRVFEQDLLYERKEEPTKMTMKEINEHFGKPIEIVE